MHTLRRIAATPAPARLAAWRLELLALTALAAGIAGQVTGAY